MIGTPEEEGGIRLREKNKKPAISDKQI